MFKTLSSLLLSLSFAVYSMDVPYTTQAPVIDGINNETQWQKSTWYPLKYLLVGSQPTPNDFSGRYRLLWNEEFLFLQAEITDDIIFDQHADPLHLYWDDDCLEIFIDEDASGGDHQYNHNAFAYHVALDNQAVDIGQNKQPQLYNDHLISRWQRSSEQPNKLVWEVALRLYPDTYQDDKPSSPVVLTPQKQIGFMLAYCDNDGSQHREHFMASVDVKPVNGDKNLGWIDASVFGKLTLVGENEQ